MPNLAPLTSKLSLDPREYIQGLDQAQARLKSFTATASTLTKSVVGGSLTGNFAQSAMTPINMMAGGGLIGGGIAAFQQWSQGVEEARHSIADTSKEATRLGMSYNTTLAMQSALGENAGALTPAMAHLGRNSLLPGVVRKRHKRNLASLALTSVH